MLEFEKIAGECRFRLETEAGRVETDDINTAFTADAYSRVKSAITSWTGYENTPLVSLAAAAAATGVDRIGYKDESDRFGLKSFKALGGAYAVQCLLTDVICGRLGVNSVTTTDLERGRYGNIVRGITVTCASDGNHGLSVAWGAKRFGCKCAIYLHEKVSESRSRAIAAYGAEVVRVSGNYDDSVRQAWSAAEANGWNIISDTSYAGYREFPLLVMQGYRVMVQEVLEQSRGTLPTHVFIQGGVGGLAAAVIAHIVNSGLTPLPRFIIVEPNEAACLFESAAVGHPVAIEGDLDTIMAGLSCGEVSQLAWPTIASRAAAYMTIPDSAAVATMRLLADGRLGPPTVGGESAVAGLAGFLVAALNEDWREKLGLNRHSRILVFGTEGDTDPERYRAIVGANAREIQRRQ